jgi:hypothetical protein
LSSNGRAATQNRAPAVAVFAAAIFEVFAASASADPMLSPTVQYTFDAEITRDSDHSYQIPVRYVYAGRRMRVEMVGIVKLIDLDLQQWVPMIPRVKTYWSPTSIPKPPADSRRWVGVEAKSAQALGTEMLLGRSVTKYLVRGTVFEERTPFEGHVWTTAENIVMRVEGAAQANVKSPIIVTPIQLVVAPVDANLLVVPSNYGRGGSGEAGWRRYD